MALPTKAVIEAAAQSFITAAEAFPDQVNVRAVYERLETLLSSFSQLYRVNFAATASGANIAALFAVLVTAKGSALEVGDQFSVAGAGDTTDTVLATAKGSAPAAGNVFVVTNVAAPAVLYVGATATDFSAFDRQSYDAVA